MRDDEKKIQIIVKKELVDRLTKISTARGFGSFSAYVRWLIIQDLDEWDRERLEHSRDKA